MTRFVAHLSWGIANQLYAHHVLLYRARLCVQAYSGTTPRRLSKKQTGGSCFTHSGTLWNNHAFFRHPFELFGMVQPKHSHVLKHFPLLPTDSIFGSTLSTHHLTPGQLILVPDAVTPWDVFWFSWHSFQRSFSFCFALVLLLSSCYILRFDFCFGFLGFFSLFHLTICAFVGNFLRNALNYSFQLRVNLYVLGAELICFLSPRLACVASSPVLMLRCFSSRHPQKMLSFKEWRRISNHPAEAKGNSNKGRKHHTEQ